MALGPQVPTPDLVRGKLELSSSLQVTFIEDVCCNNKEGVGGAKLPRRWYGNTNFNPPN